MAMFGESRGLSLTVDGSSTNASFGAVSGAVVEVTQKALDHPAGRAGAITPSKFSLKTMPAHGVPVGVDIGVPVAVGVAVAVAVGVDGGGVGVGLGQPAPSV